MTEQVELRCSQLPLFMLCAGSAMPIRNKLLEAKPEANDPAELGTAVHVLLQDLVEHPDREPYITEEAETYNVDPDDLAQLYYYGTKCWPLLREHFGEHPVCEEFVEDDFATFRLTGHPDIVSDPDMDSAGVVVDWKSGRVEYDASWQLHGGGLLTQRRRGVIVWLRDAWSGGQPFEVIPLLDEDECLEALGAQVEKIGTVHTPGDHCVKMYCDRQHECEAFREWARSKVHAWLPEGTPTLPIMDERTLGIAMSNLPTVKKMIEQLEAFANDWLDSKGDLPLPNGRKLARRTVRRKVWNSPATMALLKKYGVEDRASCFKVKPKVMEAQIKKRAEAAGKTKGKHFVNFLEEAEETDAMFRVTGKTRKEVNDV